MHLVSPFRAHQFSKTNHLTTINIHFPAKQINFWNPCGSICMNHNLSLSPCFLIRSISPVYLALHRSVPPPLNESFFIWIEISLPAIWFTISILNLKSFLKEESPIHSILNLELPSLVPRPSQVFVTIIEVNSQLKLTNWQTEKLILFIDSLIEC